MSNNNPLNDFEIDFGPDDLSPFDGSGFPGNDPLTHKRKNDYVDDAQAYKRHKDSAVQTEGYQLPFRCDSCTCRFQTIDASTEHMNAEGHWYPYLCDTCHRRFLLKSEADEHMTAEDHYPKSFQCETCEKVFRTEELRDQHMDIVGHWLKGFKCGTCPKSFRTEDLRNQHQKSVGHYLELYCTDCNKHYSSISGLNRHHNTHKAHQGHKTPTHEGQSDHGDQVPCPFCKVLFVTGARGVAGHIEVGVCPWAPDWNREKVWQYYQKRDPQGVFTVPPDSQYKSEHDSQENPASDWDTASASLECSICHKVVKTKVELQVHMVKHIGQAAMYHCPGQDGCLDDKTFGSLQSFFRHLRSEGCASLNLHTVLCTVTCSDWPRDTSKWHMLGQILACLNS